MAIVKIFPNDPKKSDFSIRFFATKYHLFEGDKILRSNLKSVEEAESEMNKIVAERLKANLSEVKVVHNGFDPELKELPPHKRVHTYALKNCVICGEEFKSIRSNNVFCSIPCANSRKARQRRENKKENLSENSIKVEDSEERDGFEKGIKNAFFELESEKENLKEFENLRKEAIHEKKRENYVDELLECISLQVQYEVWSSGACDWDAYYKALLRLNVVYYNNANMFLALPEIFGVDAFKKPIALSSIMSDYQLVQAKKSALKFMLNMNTFPSHSQHSALASMSLIKPLLKQFISMSEKMEAIQKENLNLSKVIAEKSKVITELAEQVRTVSNDNKNIWEKLNAIKLPRLSKKPVEKKAIPIEVVPEKKKKSWFNW